MAGSEPQVAVASTPAQPRSAALGLAVPTRENDFSRRVKNQLRTWNPPAHPMLLIAEPGDGPDYTRDAAFVRRRFLLEDWEPHAIRRVSIVGS
jgi:hypothetical protein